MTEEENCIFCKIVAGEIFAEKVYEGDNFIAFSDANPKIEGHCLIVSKKHFANIIDMPASLGGELIDAIKSVAEIKLKAGFEGFNLVMNNLPSAGQIVMHAHIHLLPRKKGDGFNLLK